MREMLVAQSNLKLAVNFERTSTWSTAHQVTVHVKPCFTHASTVQET
jgi:hypothetical protein